MLGGGLPYARGQFLHNDKDSVLRHVQVPPSCANF